MSKMDAYEKGHGPGQPAPDKFQLHPGDIEWTKNPPKGAEGVNGKKAGSATPGGAKLKALSGGQRRDLAKRLRAKLQKKPTA
jgi:hypothetical protein